MRALLLEKLFFKPILILIFVNFTMFGQKNRPSWREAQHQNKEWYGSQEAKSIADNVVLYQHNNGGWLKNIKMAKQLSDAEVKNLTEEKKLDAGTTIDNGATHTQMMFLAKVNAIQADPVYQNAFFKGLDYLLAAQYPNGGWPQFYPKKEGYYEHITYNDNAMISVMFLLKAIAEGDLPYGFVTKERREKAQLAIEKGLEILLKTQIRIDGKLTVWCAQYDREYLSPAKARAYELPSLSGSESVGIVRYLMQLPHPNAEVKMAIQSAVLWFQENKITGKKVMWIEDTSLPEGRDRIVVDDTTGNALWARFNEIGTNRPMFVGRDGIVKNELSEIEHERRVGYSYLSNYAEKLLEKDYPNWKRKHLTTN
ncbi:pectate lyase [Flavimarina sp. Hel_I_48]|uniref:pectate lyase n=1 Tax=Flavimarina sp. Hel_I_48 TaxID=1392488 RepID=UPI00055A1F0A|nr:pectate lyase [Flavimarina sp. Hel_I_48]